MPSQKLVNLIGRPNMMQHSLGME